ncbi:MAG: hypothetical protein IPO48_06350 [Saprospiraceae bacterium]|nr:hypothetical protein [Saprospiraceae bacterium]
MELLVIDAAGNKNVCMTNIEIQQKVLPVLTIPADRTVDCEVGTTPQQLNETGSFTSSCNLYYLDFSDNLTEGDCGNKTIQRTWQVKENGTNKIVVSRVQTIRVSNLTPFDLNSVVFPGHQTLVNKCQNAKDFGPGNPATGGYPTWVNTGCSQIAVSYQDQVFEDVDDACFKIIRHWVVLDWCTFNANIPSTTKTYQQVIKVIDTEKPTIQCPVIIEEITTNTCSKLVSFYNKCI